MSAAMIFKDKKFSPLMWTQFFGALNDNIFKNSLVVLIAFRNVELLGLNSESLVSLATLVLILPFFLFSAMAGQVADKLDKAFVIRTVKIAEIFIVTLAGLGFYFSNYLILFSCLFLLGIHSAFFGPVKYSSLPELLSEDKLTAGNAYVEVGTFIAILIGTLLGGVFTSVPHGELYLIGMLLICSGLGYFFSRFVPSMRVGDPNVTIQLNPAGPTFSIIKSIYPKKAIFNSILGISWFWLLGSIILSLLPTITKKILAGGETNVTVLLALFTVGIAVGAVICEKLSFERVEIGLVPFGSLGMTLFLADLAFTLNNWSITSGSVSPRLVLDILGIAICGGLFTVPLYTLIQQRSEVANRSRVVGANNILNSMFMVLGAVSLMGLLNLGVSIPHILLLLAGVNLVVSIYIYTLVPEFTLRFLGWMLSHIFYSVETRESKNIPKEGAAVLVCNHVSYVDWLILAAAIKRPVRFVMYYKFAEAPLLRYLMRHAGVIPIAGKNENSVIFENAFIQVAESLKQGDLVCIFPEGAVTRDGELAPFKKGVEKIIETTPVPVVPMALKGLWGSFFSHKGAGAFRKIPRKLRYSLSLEVGTPVAPVEAKAPRLEEEVRSLLAS